MQMQHGKQRRELSSASFGVIVTTYMRCHVDLGTGDGRFVRSMARSHPERLVIGVDACREQLWEISRNAISNELYVIANALALPDELAGVATSATINFPWGTLLEGLLEAGSPVIEQLGSIMRPPAWLTVRLNAGALAEAGFALDAGAAQVRHALVGAGFAMSAPIALDASALRACQTTWAKRLAYGRDPRAACLDGRWPAQRAVKLSMAR